LKASKPMREASEALRTIEWPSSSNAANSTSNLDLSQESTKSQNNKM